MALQWKWNEKVGELEVLSNDNKTFKYNLYQGNAFLIMINEYEEDGNDKYALYSFFADETHAKNCLGITKGHDNIFNDGYSIWKKIKLNKRNYTYTKKLVNMLVQAFDNLEIEIYSE